MTILEEIALDMERGIRLKLFEAPIYGSTQVERARWIYEGAPFFDEGLAKLWEMREKSSSASGIFLPVYGEQEERRDFMKRPIILVQDAISGGVAGYIWVDEVFYERNNRGHLINPKARFHIGFGKEYRKFAYPALGYFIGRARGKYNSVMACWGQRERGDDPSDFFRNNGFSVAYKNGKGYAVLTLQKP